MNIFKLLQLTLNQTGKIDIFKKTEAVSLSDSLTDHAWVCIDSNGGGISATTTRLPLRDSQKSSSHDA